MKKYLTYLMSAMVLVSLFACEGPAGRDGRDGQDGLDTQFKNITLTVGQQNWTKFEEPQNDAPFYYACSFDVPEITEEVFNNGVVICYVNLAGAQQLLPYVCHYQTLDELNQPIRWTRTVDCQLAVNKLTVFVTYSDFYDAGVPEAMSFHLAILTSGVSQRMSGGGR